MNTSTQSQVTVIPPTLSLGQCSAPALGKKRRTAGYGRVSTKEEEQQTSYAAQVDYYTKYIQSNPEWEFVGVYTDEGISATTTKKRDGFNRMIQDALAGKIDLILTKSVSRFARNTVDTLTTVRKLKEKGIEVYFEKESIYTLDSKGELLITIMSSLAQEESRSISENVAWGQRKRMADGKVSMAYKQFLGYEKGPDGKPRIVEAEATIVRQIYNQFLRGMSYNQIAKQLTDQGVPTPRNKQGWAVSTVMSILKNEKYMGDAILQKTFTIDFLSKKTKANQGELPKYHVKNSHPAIIEPEVHELVQREITRRADGPVKNGLGVFARQVLCGECGGLYGAKVWHSRDKYRRVVFQCNEKYGSGKRCATPHVTEEELKQAFVAAMNQLITDREAVVEDIRLLLPKLADTTKLEWEKASALQERDERRSLLEKCVEENASVALDQQAYEERYQGLVSKYVATQERLADIEEKLLARAIRRETLRRFIEAFEQRQDPVEQFDELTWRCLADTVTVTTGGALFRFKNGAEIRVGVRGKK
ncbi:MAG: recombinase family protein [Acidobacteriota bacterium]|jgi:DNA invertase Pin-like site-specific DNA recombinase|nr:recombinase family protein [Acidobacteriota bacterium]